MERFSRTIRSGSRIILLGTMAVSPWLVGSVPARFQLWIALGVFTSFVLWLLSFCIQKLFSTKTGSTESDAVTFSLPFFTLALLGILGGIQTLVPVPPMKISSEWAQELKWNETFQPAQALVWSRNDLLDSKQSYLHTPEAINSLPSHHRVASISPALTRHQLARIAIVLTALFLGTQLFRSHNDLKLLLSTLALTGATLAIFGIGQRISGESFLGGLIPLRNGGEPFATFVNRNNAAGFLNLCQAASLGGLIASATTSHRSNRSGIVIFLSLSAFIFAGILASFSRGGIAAAIIGFAVVSPWLYQRFGTRLFGGCILFGLVALGLVGSLHLLNPVAARLGTLNDLPDAMSGRWNHWKSTTAAIIDSPLWGAGLGTYRYANLPYQQQEATVWFWNADNLFLEIAVEAGLAGLLLTVLFLATFAASLWRLTHCPHAEKAQPVLVAGVYLLTSIALQQATDFGITLYALAIPCAILIGACSGLTQFDLSYDRPVLFSTVKRLIPELRKRRTAFATSFLLILLTATTAWATAEIVRAEPTMTLCEQVPTRLNRPDIFTSEELEKLLSRTRHLIAEFPDNPELHTVLSKLSIYQIRQQEFEKLLSARGTTSRMRLWEQSSLEQIAHRLRIQLQLSSKEDGAVDPALVNALRQVHHITTSAFMLSPWTPELGLNVVLTLPLDSSTESDSSNDPTQHITDHARDFISNADLTEICLRQEALLAAGNSSRLLTVGRIALQHDLEELGISCLRRSIMIAPTTFNNAIRIAQTRFEDEQICARLLVTSQHLIDFSRQTQSDSAINVITERLTHLLQQTQSDGAMKSEGENDWIASQISLLSGNTEVAIQQLKSAINSKPFYVNWRLELAEVCIANGDETKAREQLLFVSRLAPDNAETRSRIQLLTQRLKRQSSLGQKHHVSDKQ